MKIIDGIERIREQYPYPVLTVGNFDGVHLGHQALFRMLVTRAKEKNGTSVVFTFEPHPLRVLSPERAPKLLTTYSDKVKLIKSLGIDLLICANFTREFARTTADEIVTDIFSRAIGVREIFIGSNFLFGKDRKGSPELLKKLGKKYRFEVTVLPEIRVNDSTLSSSGIRRLIAKGKVEEASDLLGRDYSVEGVVIEGARRGKALLNVPTANIATANELFPKDGVYAVTVDIGNRKYGGAANLGHNPTFRDKKFSFEVHILKLNRDILGETLRVHFIRRIRDEIKFDSVSDLALQMRKDIDQIRAIAGEHMK